MSTEMKEIKNQAEKEIAQEQFRELVEKEKVRIRSKKIWFPWRIRLINIKRGK